MSHFDEIIGYSSVKNELEKIADILRGNEAYAKLGIRTPKGLLLHGNPGLGKSLMASCLINESGRTVITCRKDKPDGEFVKYIKEAFEKAKESAPSIVFLDDMDKFANGDEMHPDSEEYVAVQSAIDDYKNCDIFVLATANSIHSLPDSLLRPGRFDRIIEIESPSEDDAAEIIRHYLKGKKISGNVDPRFIARIMDGRSCAELETVINEAGIYAGYEKSPVITKEHFVTACLKMVFHSPIDAFEGDKDSLPEKRKYIAYHEAGHALMNEILYPGSVSLAVVYRNVRKYGGFVSANYPKDGNFIKKRRARAMVALGSAAALEQVFGTQDGGCTGDFDTAFDIVENLIGKHCTAGFNIHYYGYDDSNGIMERKENAVALEIERLYRETKEIVAENRHFLDRIAGELMEKEILDTGDFERIRKELAEQKTA